MKENMILVEILVILLCMLLLTVVKNRIKIIRWIKKHKIIKFVATTIIPFIIPFMISLTAEELKDSHQIQNLVWICVIIGFANLILQCGIWIKENKEYDIRWENLAGNHAYNQLYEILSSKNSQLRAAYHNGLTRGMLTDADVSYNIFEHIRKIALEFRNTVSKITNIPTKDLDAAFIYRYTYPGASKEDKKWRWVIGKGTKFSGTLNDFVDERDSAFHYMIHNDVSTLFYNDKNKAVKERRYQFSYKDHSYKCKGSFIVAKVAFSGNDNQLCEGIIMVNSYGKKFLDDLSEHTEEELTYLILDNIFPCYRSLLTTELAMLYFRHQDERPAEDGKAKGLRGLNILPRKKFDVHKKAEKCIIKTNKKIWERR